MSFAFFIAFILLGPFAIALGVFSLRYLQRESFKKKVVFFGLGFLEIFLIPVFSSLYAPLFQGLGEVIQGEIGKARLIPELIDIWIFGILLTPVGGVAVGLLNELIELFRPKTLTEELEREDKRISVHNAKLSERASKRALYSPSPQATELRLGTFVKGDLFPPRSGVITRKGWVSLDEKAIDKHIFILGATGRGKTETIKRLVFEILENTDRDIFLVDGKGDEELASAIRGMAVAKGRGSVPIFRMGLDKRGAIYNGFRGDAEAVYNRLCAVTGITGITGEAEWWAQVARDVLQLVSDPPGGEPPRSFEELRERIDENWLLTAWKGDPLEVRTIMGFEKEKLESLSTRVRTLARPLSKVVGPEGFALEEARACIFSIRTHTVSDTGKRFLQFLIEDLKDFVGKRQRRPGVLVIDEFGAFDNENIIALLTMARAARLSVILATQTVASLGDEITKKIVLENTFTKFLMGTDDPEEVARLAGTIYQVESSYQHDEGRQTGLGTSRIQHAYRVDLNEARRLTEGEAFLIQQGRAAKIMVSALRKEDILEVPEEEYPQRVIRSLKKTNGEVKQGDQRRHPLLH